MRPERRQIVSFVLEFCPKAPPDSQRDSSQDFLAREHFIEGESLMA